MELSSVNPIAVNTPINYFEQVPKDVTLAKIFMNYMLLADFMHLRSTCKNFKAIIDEDKTASDYCRATKIFINNLYSLLSEIDPQAHRAKAQVIANLHTKTVHKEIAHLLPKIFELPANNRRDQKHIFDIIIPILASICPEELIDLTKPCGHELAFEFSNEIIYQVYKKDLKTALDLIDRYITRPLTQLENLLTITSTLSLEDEKSIRERLPILLEFVKKYDNFVTVKKLKEFLDQIADNLRKKNDKDLSVEFVHAVKDFQFPKKKKFISDLACSMRGTNFLAAIDLLRNSNLYPEDLASVVEHLLDEENRGFIPINLTPYHFTNIIFDFLEHVKITGINIGKTALLMYDLSPDCAERLASVSSGSEAEKVILRLALDMRNQDFEKALSSMEKAKRYLSDFLFLDERVPFIPKHLSQEQYVDIVLNQFLEFEKKGIEFNWHIYRTLHSFFSKFATTPKILKQLDSFEDNARETGFGNEKSFFIVNNISSLSTDVKEELIKKLANCVSWGGPSASIEIITDILPILATMKPDDLMMFCKKLSKYTAPGNPLKKVALALRENYFQKAIEFISLVGDEDCFESPKLAYLDQILFKPTDSASFIHLNKNFSIFVPQTISKKEFLQIINNFLEKIKPKYFEDRRLPNEIMKKIAYAYILMGWNKEADELFELIDSFQKTKRKKRFFGEILGDGPGRIISSDQSSNIRRPGPGGF